MLRLSSNSMNFSRALSRWPIEKKHQISLRLENKKPRGAQIAVVDAPEGAFKLVNMHLGLAERERHWQINHLLAHHAFKETQDVPELLVGDYNDREAGFVPLSYHTKRLSFAAGLRQCCPDIIRFSHGASSSRKIYRSSFIPGLHDVCNVFEKQP